MVDHAINVWFQKKSIPTLGKSLEIPMGRGVLKAKFLEEKYENKLEFPGGEGGGVEKKTFQGGSMDTFGHRTMAINAMTLEHAWDKLDDLTGMMLQASRRCKRKGHYHAQCNAWIVLLPQTRGSK